MYRIVYRRLNNIVQFVFHPCRVFQWIFAFPTVCDLFGTTLGGEKNNVFATLYPYYSKSVNRKSDLENLTEYETFFLYSLFSFRNWSALCQCFCMADAERFYNYFYWCAFCEYLMYTFVQSCIFLYPWKLFSSLLMNMQRSSS